MPGEKLFLDTNALVSVLANSSDWTGRLAKASWVGTSVICVLEFQGFSGLGEEDKQLFAQLMSRLHVLDLQWHNTPLIDAISLLRAQRALKLPDAIIAATARLSEATLLTRDETLLKACQSLVWPAENF